jgi:hypothetical protein
MEIAIKRLDNVVATISTIHTIDGSDGTRGKETIAVTCQLGQRGTDELSCLFCR